MPIFNEIIEPIVNLIPNTVYARATDPELNVLLDQIDLREKTLVVYNNLPLINHAAGRGGFVVREWPIQILILKLADFDDNTEDGDVIRAQLIPIADSIFDTLNLKTSRYIIESYQLSLEDNVKILDKDMTGLSFQVVFKTDRTEGLCL